MDDAVGKHTQTISDLVDSLRGGHEEHSFDGRERPVGLNNN